MTHLIRRDRLIERLYGAAQAHIAVLDAPVGFGKSTLIAQFLEAHPREHIFYEVAPDNTLAQFARGFADALSPRDLGARLSFASANDRAAQSKQPAAHLAYWLAEHLRGLATTVVLDGLNDAAEEPAIMEFIVKLIDATHSHTRWVVATRSSALLRIPNWMAQDVMERSIDVTELRFDAKEVGQLAAMYQCAPEYLALEVHSGGWPAGVDFAISQSLISSSAVYITNDGDYESLSAQMFTALTKTTRDVLLSTCLLAEIDIQITSEVAGIDSGPLFIDLSAAYPWMFSLNARTLRYHDRFRAFLTKMLGRSNADLGATAARLAGALYAYGHIAQALILLTRFSRSPLITTIIENHGLDVIENGDAEIVAGALATFDRTFDKNPFVMAVRAMLDSRLGRTDTAEAWYRLAIDALSDDPRRGDMVYRYALELVRGYRVDWLEMLRPYIHDDLPDDVLAIRGSLLAQGYSIAGDATQAEVHIRRALDAATRSADVFTLAMVEGRASFIAFNEGSAVAAKSYAIHAAERAVANGLYELAARTYSVLFAIAYDLEDDAVASFDYLVKLADCSIKSGNIQQNFWALAAQYGLLIERGDEAAAALIHLSLQSFDLNYLSTSFGEALLPSQALIAAWRGDFAHAHALLLPSAQTQADAERRALRWAEVAFYAAAAGLLSAAHDEIAKGKLELEQLEGTTARSIRAELMFALTFVVLGQLESASAILQRVARITPQTTRTTAFANMLDVFANWRTHNQEPGRVSESFRALEAVQLGGFVRALEAVPLSMPRQGHEPSSEPAPS